MTAPIDYRNATWDQIQGRLEGLRLETYAAWQKFGPGTTRGVAAVASLDLLTFRPRSTELFQMGLLRLVENRKGESGKLDDRNHEGIYIAVPLEEARAQRLAELAPRAEQFLMAETRGAPPSDFSQQPQEPS